MSSVPFNVLNLDKFLHLSEPSFPHLESKRILRAQGVLWARSGTGCGCPAGPLPQGLPPPLPRCPLSLSLGPSWLGRGKVARRRAWQGGLRFPHSQAACVSLRRMRPGGGTLLEFTSWAKPSVWMQVWFEGTHIRGCGWTTRGRSGENGRAGLG